MTIGVLGGGQLGRMLALAGTPLGHEFVFYDTKAEVCSARLGELIVGTFEDAAALTTFAKQVDVITYENENLPLETITLLEQHAPVHPPKQALAVTQDRLNEKQLADELNIPVAPYLPVDKVAELQTVVEQIGYPCIVKTRRMGYDGKGQAFLADADDLPKAEALVRERPCIVEQCIAFERELSIVSCRNQHGDVQMYPLTENVHREGILHVSRAPATADAALTEKAQQIATRMLEHFDYVGTLAIELFALPNGDLLLNEMAPRVHNSGHWTIEGAHTSQFENHVRALTGVPLGSAAPRGYSAMVNLIGTLPKQGDWLHLEGVHLHEYGKTERPNRKIGHITVCHEDQAHVDACVQTLLNEVTM